MKTRTDLPGYIPGVAMASATLAWSAFLGSIRGPWDAVSWGSAEWSGAPTVGAALDIADKGWPDGMEYVRRLTLPALANLSRFAQAEHEEWIWDQTGGDYDVGEYLRGAPECWLACSPVSERPVVTITANIAASCGVPTEMLKTRGAAVAALVTALSRTGYAVRLYAACGFPVDSHDDKARDCYVRTLLSDDAGGPLDMDRILFALAHPAGLRNVMFSAICELAKVERHGGHTLGLPRNLPDGLGWGSDLYLPAITYSDANWGDPAAAERWIADTYRSIAEGKGRTAKG